MPRKDEELEFVSINADEMDEHQMTTPYGTAPQEDQTIRSWIFKQSKVIIIIYQLSNFEKLFIHPNYSIHPP